MHSTFMLGGLKFWSIVILSDGCWLDGPGQEVSAHAAITPNLDSQPIQRIYLALSLFINPEILDENVAFRKCIYTYIQTFIRKQ